MDHETEMRRIRAVVEGTIDGTINIAEANGLLFDVVLMAVASEVGVLAHVQVKTSATGPLPSDAVETLTNEINAALSRFLRKCPNIAMRPENTKGGEPWKKGNN